jgi:amino acid adenylation domain-containing protein
MSKKTNVKNIYGLSPMQEGMLFHALKEESSPAYVEQLIMTLQGKVNESAFEEALQRLIDRYDILRTVFVYKSSKRPRQVVLKEKKPLLLYKDISHMDEASVTEYMNRFQLDDQKQGFDLTKGPLMRFALIKVADEDFRLFWSYHHILMDGWCLGLLFSDFAAIYRHLITGTPFNATPVEPYKHFIQWLETRDPQKGKEFWNLYLAQYDAASTLPKSQPTTMDTQYLLEKYPFHLDSQLTRQLTQLAQKHQVTLSTMVEVLWGLLLQKYCNCQDIVFGAVVSGRPPEIKGIDTMVGLFINTVPIRIQRATGYRFQQLLKVVGEQSFRSRSFEYVPLAEIQANWHGEGQLFDHIIVFENYPLQKNLESAGNDSQIGFDVHHTQMFEQTHYDFNLLIMPGDTLSLEFSFNRHAYDPDFIHRIGFHFETAARQIVAQPGILLSQLDILGQQEKQQLLEFMNGPDANYPQEKTFHQLFIQQAQRSPDRLALHMAHRTHRSHQSHLTYGELNYQSDCVAYNLQSKGVMPGDIVALSMEPSIHMIISLLGILKTGAVYLPIDPTFPQDRIQYILTDSHSTTLMTSLEPREAECCAQPRYLHNPNAPAYLIYTSGSTGFPKGVLVTHSALINFVFSFSRVYDGGIGIGDRCLSLTSMSFDVSVCEMVTPLVFGSTLEILPQSSRWEPEHFVETIIAESITFTYLPPALLREVSIRLEESGTSIALNKLLVGVEPIDHSVLRAYNDLNPRMQIVNGYGPTEATICATFYAYNPILGRGIVPIGKPLPNTSIVILDSDKKLTPIGVPGELCISGMGLASGYLNQPELTHQSYTTHRSHRIYKTGDLGRWLPDGNIQFLGRIDRQVKLRGYRIELGEIENCLMRHDSVTDAVVVDLEDDKGQKYLCAYVVAGEISVTGFLRGYLAGKLPHYMVPSYIVSLSVIPRTKSGKLHRNALPLPGVDEEREAFTAPRDVIEQTLTSVYCEILYGEGGMAEIGIDANFFEIGGHSLRAITLIARIRKELDVEVPVGQVFKTPSIRELGNYIRGAGIDMYQSIQPVEWMEYYPQSSAQKRLYFLDQFDNIGTSYNIFTVLKIHGELETLRYCETFDRLIQRHESLRTSFHSIFNQQVQRVHEASEIHFDIEILEATGTIDEQVRLFRHSFDLSQPPLLRAGFLSMSSTEHLLLFDIHHIISDGTSMGILTKDFVSLFAGDSLEPLSIQYRDFCSWQNRLFQSGAIQAQQEFWRGIYPDPTQIPKLDLPTDFPRPEVLSFAGDYHIFQLSPKDSAALRALNSEFGVTLYMSLSALLNVLMFKYTRQEDIIIGSGMMGRPHVDLHPVIGMFINTLALRNFPCDDKSFMQFLSEVKAHSIAAFENQDLQFETLIDLLNLERDPSRNPLFDVMFTVQNYKTAHIETQPHKGAGVTFVPYPNENKTSKFDMTLFAYEVGDEVRFKWEYSTNLFRSETIERFSYHFINIIQCITRNPGILLGNVEVMDQEERERILYTFNDIYRDDAYSLTIPQVFAQQVQRFPDRVACVDIKPGCNHLTYHQLDLQSNRLAHYLQQHCRIGPDQAVGLLMDRSIHMIVGILGILKAGGAYLPLDATFPLSSLKRMLLDTCTRVVVSQKQFIKQLNQLQWECPFLQCYICIDSDNIHQEEEEEKSVLMGSKLWHYVGETATDEITGGGWRSSYTGEPFSQQEMDEYGDNALLKLEPLLYPEMKVLEIGCASGITMKRIAPRVKRYFGTDLSEVIIQKNRQQFQSEQYASIGLQCLPAHEIDQIAEGEFDLVIINSVIQCFHGHNYLRKVIRKALDKMSDNAYLFIGDIMDLDLKDELLADFRDFKRLHWDKDYKTKTDWTTELFVSRDYLNDLCIDLSFLHSVEFTHKIFSLENELTRYRYDALFTIQKKGGVNTISQKCKIQHDSPLLDTCSSDPVVSPVNGDNLSYIIYTSGSTGKPKGILTMHRNVIPVVRSTNYIDIQPDDRLLQLSNYAFDGSVFDIYGALLNGASLVLVRKQDLLDVEYLAHIIKQQSISVFFLTTALFNTLVDLHLTGLSDVRKILFGGERISVSHVSRALEFLGSGRILHVYGPTETTVYASYFPVDFIDEQVATIPIGSPLANTSIFILDKEQQPVPIGITGEICIAGPRVARGYLNNPELTASLFYKTYKTGDLGRWLQDGNIEFLGRLDHQVKIRGFRIELGEIESRLRADDEIQEAIVITYSYGDNDSDRHICAYVVPEKETTQLDINSLKQRLSLEVPEYLVPNYIIPLQSIPLNSSGKVDQNALPQPSVVISDTFSAPETELEKKLVAIWMDVLKIPGSFGIHDNFFQLGGHSLKATLLVSRIHRDLDIKVPLAEIFKSPTVAQLAEFISFSGQADRFAFAAIPVSEKREYYPLSSAQKRLYVLNRLKSDSTHYNMPAAVVLTGEPDLKRIETVIHQLIHRHDSFRTSFTTIDEEPVQRVHETVDFQVDYRDLSANNSVESSAFVSRFISAFDLSCAPLLRIGLFLEGVNRHILVVDMHHIISDGVSIAIFFKEFMDIYSGKSIQPLNLQYKDYTLWQTGESQRIAAQADYWLRRFETMPLPLELPNDFPRPEFQAFGGNTLRFQIGESETRKLKQLTQSIDGTLFMTLLTLFNILLARLSNQDDIVIGTPVSGRDHADLEPIIGMFVNTLVLRHTVTWGDSFLLLLQQVKERTLSDFENRDYLFEELVQQLSARIPRDMGRNPLFDVMFSLRNLDMPEVSIPGLTMTPYEYRSQTTIVDLLFTVIENGSGLSILFQYNTALFSPATIQRFIGYFKAIVSAVVADSGLLLKDIDILPIHERQQLLVEFNNEAVDYPRNKTIHHLFSQQAQRSPDGIALHWAGGADRSYLCYGELHQRSDWVAASLHEQGILSGDVVALSMGPSIDLIIYILGILKLGAVYLPIDSNYPQDRINYILNDSNASTLITSGECSGAAYRTRSFNWQNRQEPILPNHPAYIIYTSGSTGRPKGVIVPHRAVVRLVKETNYIDFNSGDRILQTCAIGFDVSTFEIWGALLNGLSLYLTDTESLLSASRMKSMIDSFDITIMWLTSGLFNQLSGMDVAIFSRLKYLLVGGDVLSPAKINPVREAYPALKIINGYGPTENTTFSTTFPIEEVFHSNIPIGKPIANSSVFIVDPHWRLQPIGVAGELCVGGDGLALGYLNNPDMTYDRFVWIDLNHQGNKRNLIYRTGDLGRWLPDGNIDFLGRMDRQIKIRGFRIELGEIENCLLTINGVKGAVVVAGKDEEGESYLCGYVAAVEKDSELLRVYLSDRLPAYMVPAYFVMLNELPLNDSGKVDREALPDPVIQSDHLHSGPRDHLDREMMAIWLQILPVSEIGIDNHFFQSGGHSLKAAILVSRIHKVFGVEISLAQVFQVPTIRQMTDCIRSLSGEGFYEIPLVETQEYYPLSSAQERIYLLDQMSPLSNAYNMPQMIPLADENDIESNNMLEGIFQQLIQRHEILRTSFFIKDGKPVQRVHNEVEFAVEKINFTTEAGSARDRLKRIVSQFVKPFDLSRAPLLRVTCIVGVLGEGLGTLLLVDNHHIISDGESQRLLMEEFSRLLKGESLQPLNLRYCDYAHWQRSEPRQEVLKDQRSFWLELFADQVPILSLPQDYPRPEEQQFDGANLWIILDQTETVALTQLMNSLDVTLYIGLLALFNVLLNRLSSEEDIVIGTVVAGRNHADLEGIMGMFVNTLALRNAPAGHKPIRSFIKEVKTTTLHALDNQDYPFEELVGKVVQQRDVSRNPLFDVLFTLNHLTGSKSKESNNGWQQLQGMAENLYPIAKFDLTLNAELSKDKLALNFQYCTHLFKPETIQRFLSYFQCIIKAAISHPNIRVAEIDILSPKERRQLLHDFNQTPADYPKNKSIHQLFIQQAQRSPDRLALHRSHETHMTYRELNLRSDCEAQSLLTKGIQPGDIVAISVASSIDMIISIIGILKTGAAYLPIDPNLPQDRIQYILNDSAATTFLSCEESRGGICRNHPTNQQEPLKLLKFSTPPNSSAYIMYTSGSTGRPKGVMVSHSSLVNVCMWHNDYFQVTPHDHASKYAAVGFDASVLEIFPNFLVGASLFILEDEIKLDLLSLNRYFEHHDITIGLLPTQVCEQFMKLPQPNRSMRVLITGGDKLNHFKPQPYRVVNEYGPTENTVVTTIYEVTEPMDNIPIGKPMNNVSVYIVDKNHRHLQPIGVAGELCVSGDSLAFGYLNRPELTSKHFMWLDFDHPGQQAGNPHFIYKTGDLGRWLPDGNIEILGRMDQQVKVRGNRVELGEVQGCLIEIDGIDTAVVIADSDNNRETYLCAYYVSAQQLNVEEIKTQLNQKLPPYMIPAFFVPLDEIPLTVNGKVDHNALPEPGPMGNDVYLPPESELEKQLLIIWADVLGLEERRIGMDTNFFDLGGNSLKLMAVAAKLQQVLQITVPVVKLFTYPTLGQLSRYLKEKNTLQDSPIQASVTTAKSISKDIAIIGMAGHFPGADNISQLWDNIKKGTESISFFTPSELIAAGVDQMQMDHPGFVPAAGVVNNKDQFDSYFFDYLPGEAAVMDPQTRIFHQCVWEVLEDAGCDPQRYPGTIGLYGGAKSSFNWKVFSMINGDPNSVDGFTAGCFKDKDFLLTIVSYKLNLNGPAVLVQTACSTSLVALHLACQSVLNGECDSAIAGGISLSHTTRRGYLYRDGMIQSPDGHCRPFSNRARGTIDSEGAAVVMIKPLQAAIKEGDHIYAIIKGSAINNDGSRKVGYTAPSVHGQVEAISQALAEASVQPQSISYIETHGTATPLGDPVELEALKKVFGRSHEAYCAIGSIKSNIGHLDSASGATGLIKTVLALKHCFLPPTLHFESLNPTCDLQDTPFYINSALKPWPSFGRPRRAGISSFGIGGTNAHVVLEEWSPPEMKNPGKKSCSLFTLSAKTATALDARIDALKHYVAGNDPLNLEDVAYTLQTGRQAFSHKAMFVASHREEALEVLSFPDSGRLKTYANRATNQGVEVVFMFPGGGAQYVEMGRQLYEEEPLFKKEMDRCFDILKPLTNLDLKEYLYPAIGPQKKVQNNGDIDKTFIMDDIEVFQPLLFMFEFALATLLMSWGITPDIMIGHSLGEFTAACLSGVLSLENALQLVTYRGKLLKSLSPGSMLSISLPESQVAELLREYPGLSLAAVNAPDLCTVAGSHEAISEIIEILKTRAVNFRKLHVSIASHSYMMEPALAQLEAVCAKLSFHQPQIPYLSNVTGSFVAYEQISKPAYWSRHLRGTVQFSKAIHTLMVPTGAVNPSHKKDTLLIEVGPGKSLTTFVMRHDRQNRSVKAINLIRHPKEVAHDRAYLLEKIGVLWFFGITPRWEKIYHHEGLKKVPLPTYPFDAIIYPAESDLNKLLSQKMVSSISRDQKRSDPSDWFYEPIWKRSRLMPIDREEESRTQNPIWLIFVDSGGVADELIAHIKARGGVAISVKPGKRFQELGPDTFAIDAANPDDYETLALRLSLLGILPEKIVFMWAIDGEGPKEDRLPLKTFFSLFYIIRILGKQISTDDETLALFLVTHGLYDVVGNEDQDPFKALLSGLLKSVSLEYPNLTHRIIDITNKEFCNGSVGQLYTEMTSLSDYQCVAYRSGRRWVREIEAIKLPRFNPVPAVLRGDGIYLITGGLGTIGMTLARYLAGSVKPILVLTGRSPNSEQSRQAIEELQSIGCQTHYIQADVTRLEQMELCVKTVESQWGSITGIIHCASVADDFGLIANRSSADYQSLLAPKISGVLVLDTLVKKGDFDFVVLASSLSAETGQIGGSGICAANAFMDAFALSRVEESPLERGTLFTSIGLDATLLPHEITEVFCRTLDHSFPYLLVSATDLKVPIKSPTETQVEPQGNQLHGMSTKVPVMIRRPELTTLYVAPGTLREKDLVIIWQDFFSIDEIGIIDDFFELGGDSLKMMTLADTIRKTLAVEVSYADLFAEPTIKALAAKLRHSD